MLFSVKIEPQVDRVDESPSTFKTMARRAPVSKRSPPEKRRSPRPVEHRRDPAAQALE
jgi:hypothetical protein